MDDAKGNGRRTADGAATAADASCAARGGVCVLGAGLTGAVAALALARDGAEVTLIDQDAQPLNRASLRNEGKIHLGFVFAKDDSLATARLMLDGALGFRRILAGLLGEARMARIALSTPFLYLVARDSLLAPDALAERYAAIETLYRERLRAEPQADYLGRRPATLFRRGDFAAQPRIRGDDLIGVFETEELAIDTQALAEAVREAVAESPRIRFLPSRKIAAVERRGAGFRVTGDGAAGAWHIDAVQVVNATWENRFRIDATIGIAHAPGFLHRLKYRVIARLPERLRGGPSATMVLGPYGDVVIRPDGTAYFSWYPLGLQGWSHELSPPADWEAACRGTPGAGKAAAMARGILAAIDRWYPGAAEATPLLVDAGAIVAYGRSDVDDPKSGLHDRTRVGVLSLDGYHSVDPGKLTTAPLFGLRAAEAVLGGPAMAGLAVPPAEERPG